MDVAIAVEVQEVRVVTVRRSRPIVAVVADIAETAIAEATITRSRIPDGLICAELTRKIHSFIGAVVWVTFKVRT